MSMMRVGSFRALIQSLKKDLAGICLKRFAPNAVLQMECTQRLGLAAGGGWQTVRFAKRAASGAQQRRVAWLLRGQKGSWPQASGGGHDTWQLGGSWTCTAAPQTGS